MHTHTTSDDVRHFVMFSSIAALFGNPGQANYSASNSYLDSLACLRHSKGLPGVSIQWPAISDVGMAAALNDKSTNYQSLNLATVKKVLRHLFTTTLNEEDAVMAPLPGTMLRKGNFPTKLLPLISDVVSEKVEVGKQKS